MHGNRLQSYARHAELRRKIAMYELFYEETVESHLSYSQPITIPYLLSRRHPSHSMGIEMMVTNPQSYTPQVV